MEPVAEPNRRAVVREKRGQPPFIALGRPIKGRGNLAVPVFRSAPGVRDSSHWHECASLVEERQ